jgi:DNA mismatch repair protein MutS
MVRLIDMDHTPSYPLPSLLWPRDHDRDPRSHGLTDGQAADLSLDVLVRALDWSHRHARQVRGALMALVADPRVIAFRQAVVAELAENEALRSGFEALLPSLADLHQPRAAAWAHESPLLLVPPRVSDLELYVECIEQLHALLSAQPLQSDGLRVLQGYVAAVRADEEFRALAGELPALRSQLDHVRSVTVGVNLDGDLRPIAATLVAVNTEPFVGPRTLTHRLLGRGAATSTPGMTALRTVSERSPDTDPLARDLQHVLSEVIQPVATALERYGRIHARPLAALDAELALYLGAIKLAERLRSRGLPTCLPRVSSATHTLSDAYNPSLALQLNDRGNGAPLILNAIDFGPGRIVFLTGPNRGGKTTYLRAVGLNQVLFQAGLFVAARAAEITPANAILTHFPAVEGVEAGAGRLDDEARRLREIFGHATADSLLLFNEPLTSTGEAEAQVLAEDVLRALRLLGARAVYITHLHALASELESLNHGPGALIASWVAGVGDDAARTYVIRPGTPTARSHAATIAQQHGITFDQLAQRLAERGVIDQPKTRS